LLTTVTDESAIAAAAKIGACSLKNGLHTCIPEAFADVRGEEVIEELVQLYNLAGNR